MIFSQKMLLSWKHIYFRTGTSVREEQALSFELTADIQISLNALQ